MCLVHLFDSFEIQGFKVFNTRSKFIKKENLKNRLNYREIELKSVVISEIKVC